MTEFPVAPEFPDAPDPDVPPTPPIPAGSDLGVPVDRLPEGLIPVPFEAGVVIDPQNPDEVAAAIERARIYKREVIDPFIAALERVVDIYVQTRGVATIHLDSGFTIKAPKRTSTTRDLPAMKQALRAAGVPKDRLDKAITETIVYKADGNVLRQLAGANPDYKAAIDAHTETEDLPRKATIERKG